MFTVRCYLIRWLLHAIIFVLELVAITPAYCASAMGMSLKMLKRYIIIVIILVVLLLQSKIMVKIYTWIICTEWKCEYNVCVDYNCHNNVLQSSTIATESTDIFLSTYRAFGMMHGLSRCHVEGTVCLPVLHI